MNTAVKWIVDEVWMSAALQRVKAERAALKPNELRRAGLAISAMVATSLGELPELTALRARIVEQYFEDDGAPSRVRGARAVRVRPTRVGRRQWVAFVHSSSIRARGLRPFRVQRRRYGRRWTHS